MVDSGTVLSVLELCFGAGAALVAYSAWQNREMPAGFPVVLMAASGCGYATIRGLGSLVPDPTVTIALAHFRGPFSALIAVSVFFAAVEYTNRTALQRWWVIGLGAAFVVVDAAMYFTNPLHGLVMTDMTVTSGEFAATNMTFVWIHYGVSFLFVTVGLALLALEFSNRGVHRLQTAAMLAGIGIAFGFFLLEVFVEFHPAFDSATVGIFLGSLVLLWAINHAGLLETVPVARETLMDTMDDVILALDIDNRVVDANRAATEFLDVEGGILARPATEVFADYPDLVDQFGDATEADHEFSLYRDGERRHYHLKISPITHETAVYPLNDGPQLVGRLIVVSDVTSSRRKEEELNLLKQVFARVLRHNMRNDLNVIQGNARLLSESVPESDVKYAEMVIEYTEDLMEMSEKARSLETIIESPRARVRIDLGAAIDQAIADVLERYPDARIESSIHRPCFVYVHKDVQTAVENLVENACEHDTSPPTTVEVSTTIVEDTVELAVSDDGPGISDHELAVLESGNVTTLHHGSGLGLWIVTWIVDRSKGDIDIDGGPDGTRVTVTFPLATEPDKSDTGPNAKAAEVSPVAEETDTAGEAAETTAEEEAESEAETEGKTESKAKAESNSRKEGSEESDSDPEETLVG